MKIIFLIPVVMYAIACLGAYLFQARFIFYPQREHEGDPSHVGLEFRNVTFRSNLGTPLHGWMIPARDARYTVLYCHGNAGNISHCVAAVKQLVDRGLSVFVFDYSGYGKSGGRPGERASYADVAGAWDYLVEEAGVPASSIVIMGRSLGTAIAIDLASQVSPAAVILEAPFTSAMEMGARAYPWLPVRYLVRIRYDSARKIPDVHAPKLFVHSLEDETVPYGMGKRLYNKAIGQKTFVRVRGAHDEPYLNADSAYERAFDDLLESLSGPRRDNVRPL